MSNRFAYLSCLFALLTTNDYAQLPSARVPDGLGVNIHFLDAHPGELEMIAATGLRWVRMDCDWATCERTKGKYDFAPPDRLVANCGKLGLRTMLILDYANPNYDDGMSPHTDDGIKAFANWAAAAVTHFRGRHVMWEIYNEPNGFWKPTPEVNAYAKLALTTAKAIKAAGPDELCVGPGLSGTDGAWLEPCYKIGLLNYWDAVSVHPYGNEPPELREPHYRGVRALIDRYRPQGKVIPVLSGEWGYSCAAVSPEMQGKLLARQFLFNLSQGIPLSIWYDWHDHETDPKKGENNWGLVANPYHAGRTPVYDPKPTYKAASTLILQLKGFAFDRRIKTESAEDFTLMFSNGDAKRIVVWTLSKSHGAKLPVAGRWTATDYVGSSLGVAEGHIEVTDAPKYLQPITAPDAAK